MNKINPESGNKKLDDLLWHYIGLIQFMESSPKGLYGLDQRRSDLHKEIEKHFKGKESKLKDVLHNLEEGVCPTDIIFRVTLNK